MKNDVSPFDQKTKEILRNIEIPKESASKDLNSEKNIKIQTFENKNDLNLSKSPPFSINKTEKNFPHHQSKHIQLQLESKDNTPKDSGENTDREGQESVKIFKNQFFNVKDEVSDEENFEVFEGDSSEYDNEEEEFMVKKFAVAHEDLIKQCASRLVLIVF